MIKNIIPLLNTRSSINSMEKCQKNSRIKYYLLYCFQVIYIFPLGPNFYGNKSIGYKITAPCGEGNIKFQNQFIMFRNNSYFLLFNITSKSW